MVYHVGNMALREVQEVFRGKVNDVIVCQDVANGGKTYPENGNGRKGAE